ncbi:hypothetical protein ACFFX0_30135 [Citricoccus parietis]|uniref:Uncharacterized protein n=1 Tax=Citricoccus parietis TaxID=592307 RepID=A0ABV5G8B8_9MICC
MLRSLTSPGPGSSPCRSPRRISSRISRPWGSPPAGRGGRGRESGPAVRLRGRTPGRPAPSRRPHRRSHCQ